ncbi:hypothetical protein [Thermofilum pendens]|uniref:Uncharacterized protein n=1 Tax=Thermofilum pendens (strain DSM 2475 / Hrk 5) TaxID=368408 RepID=A1RY44_THEPD|nr:hypothetical protein [Thermofilum pendens]ABL78124.1 hypothetical protein Tpen_0722 [Thermofilum pendens Hrk 5]
MIGDTEWAGIAIAIIAFETLYYYATQRRSKAVSAISREVAELALFQALSLALLGLYSYYSRVALDESFRHVESLSRSLWAYYRSVLSTLGAVAVVDVAVSLAIALGLPEASEALQYFDPVRHLVIGPLENIATILGTAWLLLRVAHSLLVASLQLRDYTKALILSISVPRLRKVTLPIAALLVTVTVILPFSLSGVKHCGTPLPPLNYTREIGYFEFDVRDLSLKSIPDVVLVAATDTSGSRIVLRARSGERVPVPAGNYTFLWVANYWANFSLHGCCFDPTPGSFCNCYVSPARTRVEPNCTITLLVWLPVNVIHRSGGTSGHVVGYHGASALSPSSEGNGWVEFELQPELREFEFYARGGGFDVLYVNGSAAAGNRSCWYLSYTVAGGGPPGSEIDAGAFEAWVEAYNAWVKRLSLSIPSDKLDKLLLKTQKPSFTTYSVRIRTWTGNCTGSSDQGAPRVRFYGLGSWNASSAPTFVSSWLQVEALRTRVEEALGGILDLAGTLYNAYLLVVAVGAGLLLLSAGLASTSLTRTLGSLAAPLRSASRPAFAYFLSQISKKEGAHRPSEIMLLEISMMRPRSPSRILGRVVEKSLREVPKYLSKRPIPSLLHMGKAIADNLAIVELDRWRADRAERLDRLGKKLGKLEYVLSQKPGSLAIKAIRKALASPEAFWLGVRIRDGLSLVPWVLRGYDYRLRRLPPWKMYHNEEVIARYFPEYDKILLPAMKEVATHYLERTKARLLSKPGGERAVKLIDEILAKIARARGAREVGSAVLDVVKDKAALEALREELVLPDTPLLLSNINTLLRIKALDRLEEYAGKEARYIKKLLYSDSPLSLLEKGPPSNLWEKIKKEWEGREGASRA